MHSEVGRNYRQTARHGLYQWMSEGLGIGGCDVNIAGAIHVVQKAIWDGTEFDELRLQFELIAKSGSIPGAVSAWVRDIT